MFNSYLKKVVRVLLFLSTSSIIHTTQYVIINNSSMTVFVDFFSDERGSSFIGGLTVNGKQTVNTNNSTPVRSLKFYTGGGNPTGRMNAFVKPTSTCDNQTFEIKDDVNNVTVSNNCN